MKFVAYGLGVLQILTALLAVGSAKTVIHEVAILAAFGFGSVCICLGGVMSSIGRLHKANE